MQAEILESLRLAVALFLNGESQNAAWLLARKVGRAKWRRRPLP
jgi:hypothetical protein